MEERKGCNPPPLPPQDVIDKCLSNTVQNAINELVKDTQKASSDISNILQSLQDKYNTLEFNVEVQQIKQIEGATHLCFIGVKLV